MTDESPTNQPPKSVALGLAFVAGLGLTLMSIAAAIGVEQGEIGFDNHKPHMVKAGNDFLFVPLNSLAAVRKAAINPAARQELLGAEGMVGAFIYCRGGVSATAAYHALISAFGKFILFALAQFS